MKILLVSSSTLPSKGGSSIIVENLAKNFSREEMIVLGSRKILQKNIPHRSDKKAEFRYFISEMDFFGRGGRFFDWFRRLRFQPLVKKIKSILQQEKIDHVIGVYPNQFYCHAACLAAKEMKVPFSSYFHNTYVENAAITSPRAAVIQKEVFDNSKHIFVMSKGMQKFYEEKYQLHKFVPLVHTFDKFPKLTTEDKLPGAGKEHYKLVAIGNFNESNLEATKRFIQAIKKNPKYSLSVFTHVPKMLLRQRGIEVDAINYEGFVSPDEVYERLQNYDICVLTHGFQGGYGEVEYRTIFPTRTIPFLLSGKPIFAHSPQGSFLNDFIMENNCAELVDLADEKAIITGLDRIADDKNYQAKLVAASNQTAQLFHGSQVVKKLKSRLSQPQKLANEIDL